MTTNPYGIGTDEPTDVSRMRSDIARQITRERTAAQVGQAPSDRKAMSDLAEAAWRQMNPALAEFYDRTAPAVKRAKQPAKSVRS